MGVFEANQMDAAEIMAAEYRDTEPDYREYERLKSGIAKTATDHRDYERKMQALAMDLGV